VELPKSLQEDPFREYAEVQKVISDTQFEVDERKSVAKTWWMPYHISRETWHSYDVSARAPKRAWLCASWLLALTPTLHTPLLPAADQEGLVLGQQEALQPSAQVGAHLPT
jgi:hypothetical protein